MQRSGQKEDVNPFPANRLIMRHAAGKCSLHVDHVCVFDLDIQLDIKGFASDPRFTFVSFADHIAVRFFCVE